MAAKSPPDARTIFRYAEAFSDAAEIAVAQFRKVSAGSGIPIADAGDVAPCATLDAFALELYLKCLQVLDNGRAGRGHDCKLLFESLKTGTQKAIKMNYSEDYATSPMARHFAQTHPHMPMGFDPYLEISRNMFERVRYLYEGREGQIFYWPMLRLAVRKTILSIHPDWATGASNPPRTQDAE